MGTSMDMPGNVAHVAICNQMFACYLLSENFWSKNSTEKSWKLLISSALIVGYK
jgi:hypothetical protein